MNQYRKQFTDKIYDESETYMDIIFSEELVKAGHEFADIMFLPKMSFSWLHLQ